MADNTRLNTGSGGDMYAADDIGGVKHQRVKIEQGDDGSATDVSYESPLPVQNVNTSRTELRFYAVGTPVTTTLTMLTLTKSSGVAATIPATSFLVTPGKRFKITLFLLRYQSNPTI